MDFRQTDKIFFQFLLEKEMIIFSSQSLDLKKKDHLDARGRRFQHKNDNLARKFKFLNICAVTLTNMWSRSIFCEVQKIRLLLRKLRKVPTQ